MKNFRMPPGVCSAVVILMACAFISPKVAWAQGTARTHGRVTNAAGQPITNGEVRLTTDRTSASKDRKYQYTVPIDSSGGFAAGGIAPGTYVAIVFQGGKSLDFIDNVILAAGDDKLVNFDMTRQEYLDQMSPEDRKALEEYKKSLAEYKEKTANNAQIQGLNVLLTQARADNKAGKHGAAIDAMSAAIKERPTEAILWITLGDGYMGQGDDLSHSPNPLIEEDMGPFAELAYHNAAVAYQNGINLNGTSKKVNVEILSAGYSQLGIALAKVGDLKGSDDSFNQAVKAQPANATMYYYNEAAVFYNVFGFRSKKQSALAASAAAGAVVAADKVIALDPTKAAAYYIKAMALAPRISKSGGRSVAPPGLVAAANKYLELAPSGYRADDMKELLARLNGAAPAVRK